MDSVDRDQPDPARSRQAEISRRHRARRRRFRKRHRAGNGRRKAAGHHSLTMRSFRDLFGMKAAARGRAPGRVNLIGDHTDYNDGLVLPTVIPQQTVVELAVGAGEHQAYSTTLDRITAFGSGEMSDFGRYVGGCVRVLEQRGIEVPPLRIRIASDVPVGAGLSSSAALEVAMLRG